MDLEEWRRIPVEERNDWPNLVLRRHQDPVLVEIRLVCAECGGYFASLGVTDQMEPGQFDLTRWVKLLDSGPVDERRRKGRWLTRQTNHPTAFTTLRGTRFGFWCNDKTCTGVAGKPRHMQRRLDLLLDAAVELSHPFAGEGISSPAPGWYPYPPIHVRSIELR